MSLCGRGALLATLVAVAVLVSGCTQGPATPAPGASPAAPGKLVIAIQPTEAAAEISPRARELETFLEDRTGADVEILIPTTYAGVIEALRFGHAHAAFMSAWPMALASGKAGADIAVAEVREVVIGQEKLEKPFYFSYWVVPKGSPYRSLAELKGKKACFSSPLSTSGYVMPLARLVELGLVPKPAAGKAADPKTFFGEAAFGGGYSQCWAALKSGQVDVSIIAGDVAEKLYREVLNETRVLEQQGPIPSHGVVFSRDLQEPLRTRLEQALLALGEPARRDLMRKLVSGIFVRFERTDTATHVAALDRALAETGLKFTESL
ncbi:MAG: phosphate/phosphite/phosphonate ABC transporter substrate-binding protein [Halobacteria archaeon]